MTVNLQEQKATLRKTVLDSIKGMPAAERAQASAKICARLIQQTAWKNARSVSFFAPLPEETDIWPLISQALALGKDVVLPRYSAATKSYVVCQVADLESDVRSGTFGIREPATGCTEVPLNRLDLILVPGVAFDLSGRRLGKGKGFYDRLLAGVSGKKCGIAFDEQIVDEVPAGPHDVSLNCILTPTRWIET
jgi:5-formyltetrahydrofolate cyclo-ligase